MEADHTEPHDKEGEPVRSGALTRLRRDRIVAGVASGIARYYGFKVVHVRMAFIFLALLDGLGVILYLLGVIFIPAEQESGTATEVPNTKEAVREFIDDAQKETQTFAARLSREDFSLKAKDRGIVWLLVGLIVGAVLVSTILPGSIIMLASNTGLVVLAALLVYIALRS